MINIVLTFIFSLGLFTATSIGLIPFRVLDTWRESRNITPASQLADPERMQELGESFIGKESRSSVEEKPDSQSYTTITTFLIPLTIRITFTY